MDKPPTIVHRIIDRIANGKPKPKKRVTQVEALEAENRLIFACRRARDMAKQVSRQHKEGLEDEDN